MKTGAARAPDATSTATACLPRGEARGERVGASFPDVLGRPGASADAQPCAEENAGASADAGPGESGVVSAEGEGGAEALPPVASVIVATEVAAELVFARARGRGLGESAARSRAARGDPLDPATRQAAHLALPPLGASLDPQPAATTEAPALARARSSLEDVLPAIVRRIAWSGDGRKGSVRLEFGAGALAGGTLVVHAEGGRVKVELQAPAGVDASAWRDRIAARFEEKRIPVDELLVE